MAILSASGLARTFTTRQGPVEAVRGVDLRVRPGEIVGLLGPNGAGKTTTLLPPTGGAATVAGRDLVADPAGVRARIGYVAQSSGVDPQVAVREEPVTQGRLYRLPKPDAAAGRGDRRRTRHRGPARPALRRALRRPAAPARLALGLVHRPALLFLDEPTTGLDPGARAGLWDLVRRLRSDHGTTVVLTTHYLDEADALADRIVVVDHGVVVADGTPRELKRRHAGSPDASLQDAFLALTGRPAAPARDPAPLSV